MRLLRFPIAFMLRSIVVGALLVLVAAVIPLVPDARAQGDLISADGVGPALVGSTIDQLRDQLPDDWEISDLGPVTVDFDGYVVRSDDGVEFRAVLDDDSERLTIFIISNDRYETRAGVSPGDAIADIEDIYGSATLTWNPDQESREFAAFANQPDGLLFRTPGVAGRNVGEYGDDEFETTEYDDDAAIASIWVSCTPDLDCPDLGGSASAADDPDDTDTGDDDTGDDDTGDDEPTPTPTEEPTPAPTEEPDDDDEAAASSSSSSTTPGALPRTGGETDVLMAMVAMLLTVGGVFVLSSRWSKLGPRWLGSR